jgi:hypothetical protein
MTAVVPGRLRAWSGELGSDAAPEVMRLGDHQYLMPHLGIG